MGCRCVPPRLVRRPPIGQRARRMNQRLALPLAPRRLRLGSYRCRQFKRQLISHLQPRGNHRRPIRGPSRLRRRSCRRRLNRPRVRTLRPSRWRCPNRPRRFRDSVKCASIQVDRPDRSKFRIHRLLAREFTHGWRGNPTDTDEIAKFIRGIATPSVGISFRIRLHNSACAFNAHCLRSVILVQANDPRGLKSTLRSHHDSRAAAVKLPSWRPLAVIRSQS